MKTGFTKRKCPKCGGNLYLDSDYCIEGGFIDLPPKVVPTTELDLPVF